MRSRQRRLVTYWIEAHGIMYNHSDRSAGRFQLGLSCCTCASTKRSLSGLWLLAGRWLFLSTVKINILFFIQSLCELTVAGSVRVLLVSCSFSSLSFGGQLLKRQEFH